MINRNCLQKTKEVGKNLKSNKKFNFNKKNHPDKYRKNNKVCKNSDLYRKR